MKILKWIIGIVFMLAGLVGVVGLFLAGIEDPRWHKVLWVYAAAFVYLVGYFLTEDIDI